MESPRVIRSPQHRHFIWRVIVVVSIVTAVGLGLALLGLAWTAMLALFGGVLMAVLFDGVAGFLHAKTRMPRKLALVLILLAGIGSIVGLGFWIGPNIGEHTGNLYERMAEAWTSSQGWLEQRAWGQRVLGEIDNVELSSLLSPRFGGLLGTMAGTMTLLVLMVAFGVYFAFDPEVYVRGATRLIPAAHRSRVRELFSAIARALRGWLIGRFASMAVVGVGTGLGLWIAGVPMAWSLGVLAGLLSFVPNVGPMLAALPGVLIGFSVSPETALWAALVYAGVQVLENYLITPLIQQRMVSVPPALLLGFQMLMGLSAGVMGLLLATPILVTLMVLVQTLWLRDTLGQDLLVVGEEDEDDGELEDLEDLLPANHPSQSTLHAVRSPLAGESAAASGSF